MRVQALVLTIALLGATQGYAATDIETFEKKVGKAATDVVDVFDKPKGLCVCLADATADDVDAAGVLDRSIINVTGGQRVRVRCMVRRFNVSGDDSAAVKCDDWVPLRK